MKPEEQKELLRKDLCARLPYGVKIRIEYPFLKEEEWHSEILYGLDLQRLCIANTSIRLEEFKPYLFPLSSMTNEHLFEVQEILGKNEIKIDDGFLRIVDSDRNTISYLEIYALLNWFYKNHYDIYGLIPMGLAIDATELNIY